MTVARHYVMIAPEGKEAALEAALGDLAGTLMQVPGYKGAELMQDAKQPTRFVFIERWASIEAHRASGEHLPKGALDALQANLAGKPEGAYLNYLIEP